MAKARREGDVLRRIEGRLAGREGLLEKMGYTAQGFMEVILNAMVANPAIAECDPDSVDKAVVRCLAAGLVPDGDEAVIAPFGGKASVIWGYKGLMRNARVTTPALALWAATVWKEDIFVHKAGANPVLEHTFDEHCPHTPDNVRACYAVAWMPGARFPEIEVMYRNEIDRHKAYASKKAQGEAWKGSYGEMGEKSCLIQICKRLPQRPEHRDDSHLLSAERETRAAVPALEHLPSRTLADAVPGDTSVAREAKAGLAGGGATARRAAANSAAPVTAAQTAPPPAKEDPPIEAYNEKDSPF